MLDVEIVKDEKEKLYKSEMKEFVKQPILSNISVTVKKVRYLL